MESLSDDSKSSSSYGSYDDDFRPLRYSGSEDDSKDRDQINQDENQCQNVRCSAVSFDLSPFYF